MSRLLKFIRGMIGMGLTFAAGVSGGFSIVVVLKWLFFGGDLGHDMIETVLTGAAPTGFLIGIVFSGGLALYGHHHTLAEISPPEFLACGALAGFLMRLTFVDLTWTGIFFDSHLLTVLGAVGGTVVFGLARRATDAKRLGAGKAGGDLSSS